jgi:hypothetical protein
MRRAATIVELSNNQSSNNKAALPEYAILLLKLVGLRGFLPVFGAVHR